MAETKTLKFLQAHRDRGQKFYRGAVRTLIEKKANRILDVRNSEGNPVAEEVKDVAQSESPVSGLADMTREELDAYAESAGVENAASLPNKGAVIEAIEAAES